MDGPKYQLKATENSSKDGRIGALSDRSENTNNDADILKYINQYISSYDTERYLRIFGANGDLDYVALWFFPLMRRKTKKAFNYK